MSDAAPLPLDGRVALVTGATRGLGRAVARKLAECGCAVYLVYAHDEEAARAAEAELSGLRGPVTAVRADVGDPVRLGALLGRVGAERGRLDVFVHNTAVWHPGPASALTAEDLGADVSGALDPLLRAVPRLTELMAQGGRIVAVSSAGAHRVIPGYAGLGVAKAALESLVRYLAVELAGRGITVNAVSTAKLDKGAATTAPHLVPALAARTPAGRLTRPGDVADAVALLCTDEAAWIQGQVLTVDGGLSLGF